MIKKNVRVYLTRDVLSTVLLTLTRLITGPVTMLLVPVFLTAQMQGFWFTFASISALSIFADLGFTIIVTQFAAHEFAHLHMDENKKIVGNIEHFDRLASFFRFICRWCIKMVLITFPIIFLVGYLIFRGEHTQFSWLFPWIIYVFASGILFISNVVFSFFEGCKMMANVQMIRFFSLLTNFLTIIVCLVFGLSLYSIAIAMVLNASSCVVLFYIYFSKQLKQLLFSKIVIYPWRKDVLKLLWKYAISWSSGYFVFQIFTPVAFHYFGAVVAGRIGITFSLISAVSSVSNVWLYVATPEINSLISKNKVLELNIFFKKQVILAAFTYLLISIICLVVFYFIPNEWSFKQRFLDFPNLIFLLGAWFLQLLIAAMASYMRAQKEEPLMLPSVVSGIYIAATTILAANFLPRQYFLIGFLSSFLFVFPWVFILYRRKKDKLIATSYIS